MIHDVVLPECSKTIVAQEMRVLVTCIYKDQINKDTSWVGRFCGTIYSLRVPVFEFLSILFSLISYTYVYVVIFQ